MATWLCRGGSKFALDLFCGAGGVGLALRRSGYRVVGIDNDPDAVEIYRSTCGEAICADIRTLNPDFGRPDLLWASPPCQPWSEVRRQLGLPWGFDHRDGDLLMTAVEWITALQPLCGVIENVGGIPDVSLSTPIERLEQAGYTVTVFYLNARFWVPQDRDHVFIIAAPHPVPVPSAPPRRHLFADIMDGHNAELVQIQHLRYAIATKRAFSTPVIGPNDVLPTVSTRPYSARWTCFVMEKPGHLRFPTFIEAARAQGFPDDHPLHDLAHASVGVAWRLLGNAVPVPLAAAVIKSIDETIIWQL